MSRGGRYLAVDLGASSGRVVLGRLAGGALALEELHRFPNEPVRVLGHARWDVLRLWAEIQEGLRRYGRGAARPPDGVGVDTWGVDFALLDAAGDLLGPPYHYRDRRTDGVMERLARRLPRERLYARTGIQFMPINTLVQLAAMDEAGDPQLHHAATLLFLPDLFHYWLSGRAVSETTIASTSQMLDARTGGWAVDLVEELGLPSGLLPGLEPPGTVLAPLRPDVAVDLGLPAALPVIATGSHDTADAVAAVPELDEASLFLSSGTWSLLGVEVAAPVLDERALALNVTNEAGVGGRVRLLKNVAGLWLLQESRRQWRREGRDFGWPELLALAEAAEPFRSLVDPDAPELLGHGDLPAAIRARCRRSGQPEPESVGQVARCCLESLALRYRWVADALERLTGRALRTIRVVGGGSRNRLLNQLTADACERAVVAGPVEATALGNVMMQAIATGRLPDVTAGREVVAASVRRERFEPRPDPAWREAHARFAALTEAGPASPP